jgi:hypothetical protein
MQRCPQDDRPHLPQTGRWPLVMVRAARAQYVSAEALRAEFHKLLPRKCALVAAVGVERYWQDESPVMSTYFMSIYT